jgi:hypothetical protein
MKIGIVGSRSFENYKFFKRKILKHYDIVDIDKIVSGGAIGTDTLAEKFASEYSIPTTIYKPDWSLGKCAGALRNKKIVDHSDIIIAFWDGKSKGTKITIDMAIKENKHVRIIWI